MGLGGAAPLAALRGAAPSVRPRKLFIVVYIYLFDTIIQGRLARRVRVFFLDTSTLCARSELELRLRTASSSRRAAATPPPAGAGGSPSNAIPRRPSSSSRAVRRVVVSFASRIPSSTRNERRAETHPTEHLGAQAFSDASRPIPAKICCRRLQESPWPGTGVKRGSGARERLFERMRTFSWSLRVLDVQAPRTRARKAWKTRAKE